MAIPYLLEWKDTCFYSSLNCTSALYCTKGSAERRTSILMLQWETAQRSAAASEPAWVSSSLSSSERAGRELSKMAGSMSNVVARSAVCERLSLLWEASKRIEQYSVHLLTQFKDSSCDTRPRLTTLTQYKRRTILENVRYVIGQTLTESISQEGAV